MLYYNHIGVFNLTIIPDTDVFITHYQNNPVSVRFTQCRIRIPIKICCVIVTGQCSAIYNAGTTYLNIVLKRTYTHI